jgi:hypothetical protein
MPPQDDVQPALPHSGPYFSTTGPTDGPIFAWDNWPALAVVDAPDSIRTIGTAHVTGWVQHTKGPAALFRLVIDDVELPGRWLSIGRRFVRADEAAEDC